MFYVLTPRPAFTPTEFKIPVVALLITVLDVLPIIDGYLKFGLLDANTFNNVSGVLE